MRKVWSQLGLTPWDYEIAFRAERGMPEHEAKSSIDIALGVSSKQALQISTSQSPCLSWGQVVTPLEIGSIRPSKWCSHEVTL